jgi:hypothetical protein
MTDKDLNTAKEAMKQFVSKPAYLAPITVGLKDLPPEKVAEAKKNGVAIWKEKDFPLSDLKALNLGQPKKAKFEPVLVHAQNVHDYFIAHHKEHNWDNLSSFTCAKMPFQEMLISYEHIFRRLPDGTTVNHLRHIQLFCFERSREYFEHYMSPESSSHGYLSPELMETSRLELLSTVTIADPACFIELQITIDGQHCPGRWFVMLDKLGAVIVVGNFGYIFINSPPEMDYIHQVGLEFDHLQDLFSKHGCVALATLQFMNCKNVEILDNPPTRQQRRHAERRGDRPPVTYKTLRIVSFGRAARKKEQRQQDDGGGRSLHIRRGHFKNYNQGAGLGKFHRHGVWWWSPAVCGHEEVGRVVKDYDVVPKEAK